MKLSVALLCLFASLIALPLCARADPPPLREQISLNGAWDEGGNVPVYGGERLSEKTYRRTVTVPARWSGRVSKIEFEAVNYQCEVFIDDKLVARHVGAWNPFTVDVSDKARPGASFVLKVVVKGMLHPPTVDADGAEQWPLGSFALNNNYGGIADDVWLRAYGQIHVDDAFIQPSFRRKALIVTYTLKNAGARANTVSISADAVREKSSENSETTPEKTFTGPPVLLAPGETKTITVRWPWDNAALWWPEPGAALYHLRSRVVDAAGGVLDRETRRWGFREIWSEKNQLRLNGVRLNLRGDYAGYQGYWPPPFYTRENLPQTYDLLRESLNVNALRWHQRPAPRFALDLADEKGLVIVCESALYGHPSGLPRAKKAAYLANGKTWIEPWAKGSRNHASILLWSVVNEMGPLYDKNRHQGLTNAELRSLGDTLRKFDTTRPVLYHGNGDIGEATVNYHYPFPSGWDMVTGSIYSWASLVHKNKPTGVGEMFQTSKTADHPKLTKAEEDAFTERNRWWLGTWTRGMRYVGFADLRPKIFFWAHSELDGPRARNVKNAFAPVALFDKAYDDGGIVPLVDKLYPVLDEGAPTERTLVLYNDTFRDTNVTVEVFVKVDDITLADGQRVFSVPLGDKREIRCAFQVPFVDGASKTLELLLVTRKNSVTTFEESRFFTIRDAGKTGVSNAVITLVDAAAPK